MSFKTALASIGKGINDLAQLNVRTYTGDLQQDVNGQSVEDLLEAARTAGQLQLVAATTMNLDGDVNQFISNADYATDGLLQAHRNAVAAGQTSRQASIEMFSAAIRKVVAKIDLDPAED